METALDGDRKSVVFEVLYNFFSFSFCLWSLFKRTSGPQAERKRKEIFNKNTVEVSYSCMDNMERIIKKHNQKILNANQTTTTHGCNCRKKATCSLENNCLTPSIVYNAKVTTTEDPIGKNYIGLTKGPFKQRYTQHALSFRNRHYANSTELSKFIWHLKDNNTDFKIKWSILTSAAAYSNKSKRCNLCLAKKFFIIKAEKSTLLNKRSELVSKCSHENKFYLMNLKADHTLLTNFTVITVISVISISKLYIRPKISLHCNKSLSDDRHKA